MTGEEEIVGGAVSDDEGGEAGIAPEEAVRLGHGHGGLTELAGDEHEPERDEGPGFPADKEEGHQTEGGDVELERGDDQDRVGDRRVRVEEGVGDGESFVGMVGDVGDDAARTLEQILRAVPDGVNGQDREYLQTTKISAGVKHEAVGSV